MLSQTGKVGITLIGLPGSGKSALAKRVNIKGWKPHDHDDSGLENPIFGLGKGGVAKKITEIGDTAFLGFESNFTIQNYGRKDENKPFSLENTIFASSGSLVRSPRAMQHIRERTFVILIDTPIERVLSNINKRPDGSGRIIGMNGGPHGEKPMHATLEEELRYRETLYQQSCDAVFLHQKDMDIDILAKQFEKFVIQVIENSTLHSA